MNKKGVIPFAVIFGVILFILLIYWVAQEAGKECHQDSDCSNDHYCGSDFKCHLIPQAETINQVDLKWPAIIIGASMIIAALIVRWKGKNKGTEGQNVYKP